MPYYSLNPATEALQAEFASLPSANLQDAIAATTQAQKRWADWPLPARCEALRQVARLLRSRESALACLISQEMGKLSREAVAELGKCADLADFYADHAPAMLADQPVSLPSGRGYVSHQPLGTVLGVMPWNYPFWQVFRFAIPALLAGNACLLKHAANVPQCAMAIQQLFDDAGLPAQTFQTLLLENDDVDRAIAQPTVRAISFTGSETIGRLVAATAGRYLKKCVLELGGSDPWVVLHDADLEASADQAVAARFINAGQACTAAKRIIVVPEIADRFVALLAERIARLTPGDPQDPATRLAPLARKDLLDKLQRQVDASVATGAEVILGGKRQPGAGYYFQATLLDQVPDNAPAYFEELFGPVAAVIRAQDEADALRLANDTRYGLGGVVWSRDLERAEAFARRIESGMAYVNSQLRSNNLLPFGGIKASGYGRELSELGIREFTNAKSIWIRD